MTVYRTHRTGRRLTACLVAAACLAGCADDGARTTVTRNKTVGSGLAAQARTPSAPRTPHLADVPWFGDTAVKDRHGVPLPQEVQSPGVRINLPAPSTLREVAGAITRITKLPVVVNDAPPTAIATRLATGGAFQRSAPTISSAPGTSPQVAAMLAAANGGGAGTPSPMASPLSPSGAGIGLAAEPRTTLHATDRRPLSKVLNEVEARLNARWSFDGRVIRLDRYTSRTWTIPALATEAAYTAELNGSLTADSSSGDAPSKGTKESGSREVTIQAQKMDRWAELQSTVQALMTADSAVVASPANGTLTVYGPPDAVDRVAETIQGEIDRQNRQVAITFEVLTVNTIDQDNYGLDWNVLFQDATSGLAFEFLGPASGLVSSAGALTSAVRGAPPNSPLRNLEGSSAAARALTQSGRASLVFRKPFTVANGEPYGWTNGTIQDFVGGTTAGTASSTTGIVNPPTLQRATALEGLQIQVIPRIVDDGLIRLTYSFLQAEPVQLTRETAGEGETQTLIQLRRQARQSNTQTITVPSGKTYIAAASTQDRATSDDAGVGHALNIVFGGRISGGSQEQQLVILITATDIDPRRPNKATLGPLADRTP